MSKDGAIDKPILGIRSWNVGKDDGLLHSVTRDGVYHPQELMHASCDRHAAHTFVQTGSIDKRDQRIKELRFDAGVCDAHGMAARAQRLRAEADELAKQGLWGLVATGYWDVHHDVPARDCTCGLYAYYDFVSIDKYLDEEITGVVAAGGKVIRFERGMRAEYMRIVAILATRSDSPEVAKRYSVPLIEPDEIALFAFAENLTMMQPAPRAGHDSSEGGDE